MIEDEDLIPDDDTPTRKLRCYCGETVINTSQVGNPPDCLGCHECHSTLATNKELCKQRKSHNFKHEKYVKICVNCGHEEKADVVKKKQYKQIFLNHKDEWIDENGQVVSGKLVEKYNIQGRYLRDGTFDKRPDIRSIEVN